MLRLAMARISAEPKHYYDCIFVSCGMTSIPPAYEEQLREGGRLVIPLGKPEGQELLRLEKRNGKLVMGSCVRVDVRFQMCIAHGQEGLSSSPSATYKESLWQEHRTQRPRRC
jgi:protein-L-isoaspartate O-methyltransferase